MLDLAIQCPYDDQILGRAQHAGILNLQLRLGPGYAIETKDGSLDEAYRAAEDIHQLGFQVLTLGFYRNMLHPDQEVRLEEEKRLRNVIRIAAEVFKVKTVGVFAGRIPDLSIEENIPVFQEFWTPVANFAGDFGVSLAFENCTMFRGYPIRGINIAHTPEAYQLMFEAVPAENLGIEFDPSHCVKQMIEPLSFMREFEGRILHFHAKDHRRLPDMMKRHGCFDVRCSEDRFPGYGEVDFAALIKELKRQGYTGPVTIEVPKDPEFVTDEEILLALEKGRKLLVPMLNSSR